MWRQGDHVCLVGATQSGKTGLAREILKLRGHTMMLVTKRDDYLWSGWKTVRSQRDIDPLKGQKWRLWPGRWERMQGEFADALQQAWLEKNWCVYLDEMYYLQELRLERPIVQLLTQGATDRITVLLGMQRPSRVTRFALSEPRYVFCFRLGDGRDLLTVKDWAGSDLARQVRELERYQFAFLDKVSGNVQIGFRQDVRRLFGAKAA